MGMKRKSDYQFSQVPTANLPRSVFSRSHQHKTTFDAGYLIPIYVDEALPGDTFKCRMTAFTRLSTPLTPIIDNIYLDVFFFAVANRFVWDNWEKFCGAQDDPGDSIAYTVPTIDITTATQNLADYMGIPLGGAGTGGTTLTVNALPFRSYNLIYNTWFKDQNLIDNVVVDTDNGPDTQTDYVLLKRGKRHDYFTSCLPWPQKGDAVSFSIGSTAPLTITGDGDPTFDVDNKVGITLGASTGTWPNTEWSGSTIGSSDPSATWNDPALTGTADLSAATSVTVNDFREAVQIQKLLERDARGGTRYIEVLKNQFQVTSPDARHQRPEYLGGGTFNIHINPVAQTNFDSGTSTIPGDLGAFGVGTGQAGFSKSFTEHCTIIGLVMARADLTYQQGINRMWSRQTRYDYYWPALSHLGEQSVLNKEIYADGTGADDNVFGYQERWAEYRYFPSMVTGHMRSNASVNYETWHLAQEFASLPTLGETFINEDPPVDRVINVPLGPHFIFDSVFNIHCARPMPLYSVPGMVDHF